MATAKKTARPMLACEICSDRVIAARINEGGEYIETHSKRGYRFVTCSQLLVQRSELLSHRAAAARHAAALLRRRDAKR